ncbi:P-loop containing nucleoside triphosphate hydrolase protein [Trichoderma afarasin]
MQRPASCQREIGNSQFGNNTTIHQDNNTYHLHLPLRPAQPVIHIIPYPRNEELVGRPDIVEKLNMLLPQTSHTYCSAALWGLGGSGKTQIALDYAYERRDKGNCSVFWVHADSEATFSQDYKTIAEAFGVNQQLKGEDLLAAVRDQIAAQPDWVLVLDNADDLQIFGVDQAPGQTKSLYQYIPRASVGTVLWTSRDARIAGTLVGSRRGIKVDRMKYDEAETLLKISGSLEVEREKLEVIALLEELQWFPLAITQAGAYMRRTETSAKEYSSLLAQSKSRWPLLKEEEFDRHRRDGVPNNVLETWSISIDHLRKESEIVYNILHVLAYVANQNISHEIITTILTRSDSNLVQPENLEAEATKAVTRLKEFSFLGMQRMEDGSKSYKMHKLVQEAARYGLSLWKPSISDKESMKKEGQAYFSGIAVQVILDLFPDSGPETWTQCDKYLAHAMQIGDWADLNEKHTEISLLFHRVSEFFFDRGRWREEELVNKRGLEFDRKTWGEKHLNTIRSMKRLSLTYLKQGRSKEAEALALQMLDLEREVLGDEHLETTQTKINLAASYWAQGRYKEAEALQVQVLDLRQKIFGIKHPATLWSMATLSETYWAQGRYKEAEALQVQVLDLRQKIFGIKHPTTLESMGSLAATYHSQGRHKEAEVLYIQVLDLRREMLGDKHPETIESMGNLASTYHSQGRYKEAEVLDIQVLNLRREILGKEHPDTLVSMHNLAWTWKDQGRFSGALTLMEECVQYSRSVLGPEHPDTVDSVSLLESWKSEVNTLELNEIHKQCEQEEGEGKGRALSKHNFPTSSTTTRRPRRGEPRRGEPRRGEPRGQQFIRMSGQNKTNSRWRRLFRKFL